MHELSLMEGVMDIAKQAADENEIKKITKIHLKVGIMTMAYPDAMQAAFETLSSNHDLFSDAVLQIEEVSLQASCRSCDESFAPDNYQFVCPFCSSPDVQINGGQELFIDFIDGRKE